MRNTCFYVLTMPSMIQIRNVPTELHRRLKARAALAGMSLSEYLLREIAEIEQRPTVDELLERLKTRSPVDPDESPADIIRLMRGPL
jgi:plasmid stability protein